MDTLTFSAPTLFRHLTFSEAKKAPITEVTLSKALEGLGMKMPQVRFSFPMVLFQYSPSSLPLCSQEIKFELIEINFCVAVCGVWRVAIVHRPLYSPRL